MKYCLAAIACLLQAAAVANTTGVELLRACTAPADSADRRECVAYIQGAADSATVTARTIAFVHAGQGGLRRLFCIGAGEAPDKVVAAVTRYLEDHPENRASNAASVTLLALVESYPCPKGALALDPPPSRRNPEDDSAPQN